MVARHKSLYFSVAWAKYDEAKKGSLKLTPNGVIKDKMIKDYKLMSEMFVSEAPTWEEIIKEISAFEKEFNLT